MIGNRDRRVRGGGELERGAQLGRYEIIERIAVGGMAEIFRARDRRSGELVVLKRGLDEMMSEPQFAAMFYDEARLMHLIDHPNIVQSRDIDAARHHHYYVMEYLDGLDVAELLRRAERQDELIPIPVAVNLIICLANALHFAHELCDDHGEPMDIVHRDVSPGNVRLTFDGKVKLLDFGIACASLDNRSVTRLGQIKGKMTYMAPEQLAGHYDRRSDVFSLGVVLYELTTVTRFFGASELTVEERLLAPEPIPPSVHIFDYPQELEDIVLKAVATNPNERYQTAGELGLDLFDYVDRSGVRLTDEMLGDYIAGVVGREKRGAHLARGTKPASSMDTDVHASTQVLDADASRDPEAEERTGVFERSGSVAALARGQVQFRSTSTVPAEAVTGEIDSIEDGAPSAALSEHSIETLGVETGGTHRRSLRRQLAVTIVLAIAAAVALADFMLQL